MVRSSDCMSVTHRLESPCLCTLQWLFRAQALFTSSSSSDRIRRTTTVSQDCSSAGFSLMSSSSSGYFMCPGSSREQSE
jgi:hypothetical protein